MLTVVAVDTSSSASPASNQPFSPAHEANLLCSSSIVAHSASVGGVAVGSFAMSSRYRMGGVSLVRCGAGVGRPSGPCIVATNARRGNRHVPYDRGVASKKELLEIDGREV